MIFLKTQARACHSSTQNSLMSCHLSQSKSQRSYNGLQDSTWPSFTSLTSSYYSSCSILSSHNGFFLAASRTWQIYSSQSLHTGYSSVCHSLSSNICLAHSLKYFNNFLKCHFLVSPMLVTLSKTAEFSKLPILLIVFCVFPIISNNFFVTEFVSCKIINLVSPH